MTADHPSERSPLRVAAGRVGLAATAAVMLAATVVVALAAPV